MTRLHGPHDDRPAWPFVYPSDHYRVTIRVLRRMLVFRARPWWKKVWDYFR